MFTASFDTFFEYYWPRLVRYLKAQTSDSGSVEDAAADAMTAVLDNWDHLVTYERPDSWLFKVAARTLRQIEARTRERYFLDEHLASPDSDLRIAAAADPWVEDHMELIAAIRSLPRRQAEVIGLHYLSGYTLTETARILDVPVGTAKVHRSRGLHNLRRLQGAPTVLEMAEMARSISA